MTVQYRVTLLCDDTCKACIHRCSAETIAVLEDGVFRVALPPGWTQQGSQVFGPNCTEERALKKVMEAEVPDPSKDPPIVQEMRNALMGPMREVVKEALSENKVPKEPEVFTNEAREVRGDEPDFSGHFGNGSMALTEVRVKGKYVEISWPNEHGMSLLMQHEGLRLINPPAFLDKDLVQWVQNCLRTMSGARLPAFDPKSEAQ